MLHRLSPVHSSDIVGRDVLGTKRCLAPDATGTGWGRIWAVLGARLAVFTMKSSRSLMLMCTILQVATMKVSASVQCEPNTGKEQSASSSAKATLHKNLFCQYDIHTPPQKIMNVSVELFLRRARVVHTTLEMRVLTNLYWNDPSLTWDPSQYDGVKEIQISTDRIWTPTIGTIVTLPWLRDGAAQEGLWPAVCHVTSNGTVACTSAMAMGGACIMSYLYWPHIAASCSAFIGLDFRVENGVRMQFFDEAVQAELLNYVPDNDWVVTHLDRDYFDIYSSLTALTYDVTLHSRGAVILTALIGPVVVISLMLLGSFFLPSNSHERLGLCCCSILGTVIASSLLFEKLPTFDGPNPIIVTTYSGLLTLSGLAILMTVFLNIVVPRSSKPPVPPRWLYTLQSWLTTSTFGKFWLRMLFMAPQDQTEALAVTRNNLNEENTDPTHHEVEATIQQEQAAQPGSGPHKIWDFIASFMDRCTFFIFLSACVFLCLHLFHAEVMEKEIDFLYS